MPPKKQTKKTNARPENTLEDLLYQKLQVLFDVENRLVKALPKMAKKASDPDLRSGFEKHLRQTEEHAERLTRAFSMIDQTAKKLSSEGIRGMIADAEWIITNVHGAAALDASLIAAAQYVEHYEIAGYESAIAWATLLGCDDVVELLQQTLDEEQETSDELTELATAKIDERAMDNKNNNNANDEASDSKGIVEIVGVEVVEAVGDSDEDNEEDVEDEDADALKANAAAEKEDNLDKDSDDHKVKKDKSR
jgi:ferritin-like metal-binding protein YciE